MQKLRVNSIAMRAPLCERGCARSIVPAAHSTHLSHPTHSIKIASMPKLTFSDSADAQIGPAPVDIANGSPFQRQRREDDLVRNGIFIGLAIVLLVFLGSMIAVLMMHAPPL